MQVASRRLAGVALKQLHTDIGIANWNDRSWHVDVDDDDVIIKIDAVCIYVDAVS